MQNRNKGFTLTELLIVVMVIGILAAVTVPKLNKVFFTSQTSEAEDILLAMRQEQVLHCIDEGWYYGDVDEMNALAPLKETGYCSKYFCYNVNSNQGSAVATSNQNPNLSLVVLSYEDGRICCADQHHAEGLACAKLNKDYIGCSELKNKLDFVPPVNACL